HDSSCSTGDLRTMFVTANGVNAVLPGYVSWLVPVGSVVFQNAVGMTDGPLPTVNVAGDPATVTTLGTSTCTNVCVDNCRHRLCDGLTAAGCGQTLDLPCTQVAAGATTFSSYTMQCGDGLTFAELTSPDGNLADASPAPNGITPGWSHQ